MNASARMDAIQPELTRDLLETGIRAVIHRLRGLQGLLAGWAVLEAKPPGGERVRQWELEGRTLLDRLERLVGLLKNPVPPDRLQEGDLPRLLLAAAWGLGTPEEAGPALPARFQGRTALALAYWMLEVQNERVAAHGEAAFEIGDGEHELEVQHRGSRSHPVGEWWLAFEDLLESRPDSLRIRFRSASTPSFRP
ncbi:MAG: hypothetical protein ACE5H3_00145 [Planctomycetota bacterium]